MVLFEGQAVIRRVTQSSADTWLPAKFDRDNPPLHVQLEAYLQELRSGHTYCIICRQPRHEPQHDMPIFEQKHASFGFILNLPTRCAAHKLSDMEIVVNICQHGRQKVVCFECDGHLVCKYHSVSGCETFGSAKYDGMCVRCYSHLFPDQPIARQYRIKERHVFDAVVARFPDRPWVLNRTIEGGCSRRRPDVFLDAGTFILVIEVDEEQHRGYSCENRRLMELFQDGGARPVVIIRFNPDDFVDAQECRVTGCFGLDSKGFCQVKPSKVEEWQARLEVLFARIEACLGHSEMNREVTVVQLFFDGFDTRPSSVSSHSDVSDVSDGGSCSSEDSNSPIFL